MEHGLNRFYRKSLKICLICAVRCCGANILFGKTPINLLISLLKLKSVILLLLATIQLNAQNPADSLVKSAGVKAFIAPVLLVTAGLATFNQATKQRQSDWHAQHFANFRTKADNVLEFVPNLAWATLSLSGIKGRHQPKDQFLLGTIANALAIGTSTGLKYGLNIERPDGTDRSFPSGHTTFAFVGASLLSKEYGQKSVWVSVAGYGVATSVGLLRMANNRHWLSDVLVGAGTGILATEITYAIYPWLKRKVFKSDKLTVLPIYNAQTTGFALLWRPSRH